MRLAKFLHENIMMTKQSEREKTSMHHLGGHSICPFRMKKIHKQAQEKQVPVRHPPVPTSTIPQYIIFLALDIRTSHGSSESVSLSSSSSPSLPDGVLGLGLGVVS